MIYLNLSATTTCVPLQLALVMVVAFIIVKNKVSVQVHAQPGAQYKKNPTTSVTICVYMHTKKKQVKIDE